MTTTVFISSFVALLAMIGTKMIEQKLGSFPLWTRLVSKTDEAVHDMVSRVLAKYQLYKKIVYLFIFNFLPAYTYELLVKMKDYVHKKYYESQSKLKGNRRMLRANGSVSSFLQEISAEPKKEDVIEEVKGVEELKS